MKRRICLFSHRSYLLLCVADVFSPFWPGHRLRDGFPLHLLDGSGTCGDMLGFYICAFIFGENEFIFKKCHLCSIGRYFIRGFLTSAVVWQVQPSRKAYLEKLRDIAMRVDTATDDELSWFGERPAQVRASLQLLRQHKLNVYRETRE